MNSKGSPTNPLAAFSRNVYSQFGEDGIVEELLQRLSSRIELDHWCVEFGAWDGIHLSNTCRLIREIGYSAVLIEGDQKRFEQLKNNFPQERVHTLSRFVAFEGRDSLDHILAETCIPSGFDFLSIDVDGNDYHIFNSLELYTPKIVCIEYNPTIPAQIDYVQAKDFRVKHGSSAKALMRLGHQKGYAVIAITSCNLILVRRDLLSLIQSSELKPEDIPGADNEPLCLFVGYDGTLLSNRDHVSMIWHNMMVPIESLQFLPKSLRIYGGDYKFFHRIMFGLWLLFRHPAIGVIFAQRLIRKLSVKIRW